MPQDHDDGGGLRLHNADPHQNILAAVFNTAGDRIQAAVAAGAMTSPWWLPTLRTVSETAALLAPILGCIWLAVQIVLKIADARRAR